MKSQRIICKKYKTDQGRMNTPPLRANIDQVNYILPQNNVTNDEPTWHSKVVPLIKQKGAGRKKKKVVSKIILPEEVVKWINKTFQEKEKNTAYKYAFAAHLQVSKIPQRKNYGFICLPKSTLTKYIKDKNLWSIKSRFAEGKVIYQEGWKYTINGNYMSKYSFNEEMFLSKLVKVKIYSFKTLSTLQHQNNIKTPFPLLWRGRGNTSGDLYGAQFRVQWTNIKGFYN